MRHRLLSLFFVCSAIQFLIPVPSVLAVDPYVDTGLTAVTPLPDSDLVIVREKFYGATGIDLSAYGITGGTHTYVQSLYFRLYVQNGAGPADSFSGLVILPPSVTILGVITDGTDLGGQSDDGIYTESDSLFAVAIDPDTYSATDRGFESGGGASSEFIGIIDANTLAFGLNVKLGVDDFRIIIDYGNAFDPDLSFDVLAVDVTPPGTAVAVAGILVGDISDTTVFGSGDYGEFPSLQDIPLTSTVAATSAAILPFNPDVSLYLARDPTSGSTFIDSYDTDLDMPLPGQFILDSNVSNPRGVTDHSDGMIYCSGRDGGFARIDPVARTVETTLLANLTGSNIDATNLPGHAEIFVVRNTSGVTQVDVHDPTVPIVVSSFGVADANTPVAIVDGSDGLLYVLDNGGTLASFDATGASFSSLDLNPPTGNYDGMTSRTGTNLLYLLRDTSGDTRIDVFNITTQLVTFDFVTLPVPADPADIADGPDDFLYVIGTGSGQPAGYTIVDPDSGVVVYSHEVMDFPGVYRTLTALQPQPTSVADGSSVVPEASIRHLAWPNPFNPNVEIRYDLPHSGPSRVRVFDVRGRLIRVLHEGNESPGWRSQTWNGRDTEGREAPSGTYLYQITAGGKDVVGKLVLIR